MLRIYVIVGIDPGIKTGYAIIDLSGRLIASGCEKEAGDERLVKLITDAGIPVLLAADTHPPSHFVLKTAARLNVRVFYPAQSMTKLEKRRMGAQIGDVHARDAYAAAIKAFRRHQNRLRQIDAMEAWGQKERDELKMMVICGMRIADRLDRNI